jgi:serine/threonine protein kinase
VEALGFLKDQDVVHGDIYPANLIMTGMTHGFVDWKLIGFDHACDVGEPIVYCSLEYTAPEVTLSWMAERSALASCAMDIYSLGRTIMWLALPSTLTPHEMYWPTLQPNPSTQDKKAFLASVNEFPLEAVEDVGILGMIRAMIKKKPHERIGLDDPMLDQSFLFNMDTSGDPGMLTIACLIVIDALQKTISNLSLATMGNVLCHAVTRVVSGKLIDKQYRAERIIGDGGSANVWKAWDTDREVDVALKMYRDRSAFLREARFLRRFRHPVDSAHWI